MEFINAILLLFVSVLASTLSARLGLPLGALIARRNGGCAALIHPAAEVVGAIAR